MKICVFDIDGTLCEGFFIIEFPKWLCENKPHAFDPNENENIQNIYKAFQAGEPYQGHLYNYESFAKDLVNAFGKGIKDQSVSQMMEIGREYIIRTSAGFSFARGLVDLVKTKGYKPIAVSGSPYEVILPFANSIGINETFATTYKHDNDTFTGEVEWNCAIDTNKKKITNNYFLEHSVDVSSSAGFGDSTHDLSFLKPVGFAVVVAKSRKSELRQIAERQSSQKIKRWLILDYLDNDNQIWNKVDQYLP